ncbi:MAG: succinate dehydrogenase [Deltaproteobacteria bacterium]
MHSLAGVVPLGVFLVEHLWVNAHAVYGRESFNRAVGALQSLPMRVWLEVLCIALPLAFHAISGFVLAPRVSVNVVAHPGVGHWMSLLQRVSGVAALSFMALHFWQYRAQTFMGRLVWRDFYYRLGVDLNRPGIFALYVTGVTASVFHLAHGLWQAGDTWGITVNDLGKRRAAWLWGAVGACLWVLGVNVLMHFALRCGGLLPMPHAADVASACGR